MHSKNDYPSTESGKFSNSNSVERKKEFKAKPIALSNSNVNLRHGEELISKKSSVQIKRAIEAYKPSLKSGNNILK